MTSMGYFVRGADRDIAGLAVRYGRSTGYKFYASCAAYSQLDGRVFATLDAVELAAKGCPIAVPTNDRPAPSPQ